eukprot:g3276.t1
MFKILRPLHSRLPLRSMTAVATATATTFFFVNPSSLKKQEIALCHPRDLLAAFNDWFQGDIEPSSHDFHLSKEIQDVVAQIGVGNDADLVRVFQSIDFNCNRSISFAEFKQALSLLGLEDGEVLKRLFEVFDIDNSGRISPTEFATGILLMSSDVPLTTNNSTTVLPITPGQRKLQFLFNVIDTNKNGKLKKRELEAIFVSLFRICDRMLQPQHRMSALVTDQQGMTEDEMYHSVARALVDDAFLVADKDVNDELSLGEFVDWLASDDFSALQLVALFERLNGEGLGGLEKRVNISSDTSYSRAASRKQKAQLIRQRQGELEALRRRRSSARAEQEKNRMRVERLKEAKENL